MLAVEQFPDRWHSRDLPVLRAAARRLERGQQPVETDLAGDLESTDVIRALVALDGGYLVGEPITAWGAKVPSDTS